MINYKLFIGGEWCEGGDGKLDIVNPATENIVAQVAIASSQDLVLALKSAAQAQIAWRKFSPELRGNILLNAARILEGKIVAASLSTCREQGKTVAEASGEFDRALETLRWNGEMARELCAPIAMEGGRVMVPEPLGVVAAFTPWNYPAVLSARKLAPPLAAGCAVILKAAEESPAAAVAIVEALEEAGVPSGVVSLVFGQPAMISNQLLSSDVIKTVTFTGSTRVGKELAGKAVENLQQCILELGGHAPVLIFEDVDIQSAAELISEYKFEAAGQSCNAPSRIFVQRSKYEEFISVFTKVVESLRVGNGENPETAMGPMIGQRAIDRMQRLTTDALSKGAKVITGGQAIEGPGYFWPPTILTDVDSDAAMMTEEPFGPIISINAFDDLDEAVTQANTTNYGLAAYVFTGSDDTKRAMLDRLEVGSVSVNMLIGVRADAVNSGVGDSGYGHEGGIEGFRAFQNLKLINGVSASLFSQKD